MDLMLIRIFQSQVEIQLKALLDAHARLLNALERSKDDWRDRAAFDEIWFSIEQLLTAAANVSKALWGQGTPMNEARRPLRESLGIDDSSQFSERRMRNHFEHFDERVDEWWIKSPSHNLADRNLGPIGMIQGLDEISMFRQFDSDTMEVIFWGDAFSIADIVAEASRILPIVSREAVKPHWEP
jgi:hypothetical protein